MSARLMIRVRDLTVRYGALVAVSRMSLEVPEGEIFGLVGPNGAGKTTTLKVLAGLLLPDEGAAEVDGFDVVPSRDDVRRRIGYMADFFGVYDYLTVTEYIAFFGGMYGLTGAALDQRLERMLEAVNLLPKRGALVRTLSRGMKQRLYFARALVHDPRLLVLDEPASGMDPRGRAELSATLKRSRDEGKTIIISSHILDELQDLCTSVGIMEAGRLVSAGPLAPAASDASRRTVALLVASGEAERALSLLRAHPGVFSAQAEGARILIELRNDDDLVSGLIRRLAEEGVRMQLPRAETADLKEVFMRMTKGELM